MENMAFIKMYEYEGLKSIEKEYWELMRVQEGTMDVVEELLLILSEKDCSSDKALIDKAFNMVKEYKGFRG